MGNISLDHLKYIAKETTKRGNLGFYQNYAFAGVQLVQDAIIVLMQSEKEGKSRKK